MHRISSFALYAKLAAVRLIKPILLNKSYAHPNRALTRYTLLVVMKL
ncbi:MAG: hypothetical protein IKK38_04550 [Spirochaetaceae bacterium]|nr:hypothetical protein [Spirochaetaceae bacterium]